MMTENEMFGWHHRLKGHEFEQAPGDGEGQGNMGCKELIRLSNGTKIVKLDLKSKIQLYAIL